MRNRPIFLTIRQYTIDHGYTAQQVANATAGQVVNLLGLTGDAAEQATRYWPGIKRLLLMDLQHHADIADMEALKATAKAWLDANFPDWQAERGREGDKPYVTIWLEGRPE